MSIGLLVCFYQDYEEHILGEVPLLIIDGFIDPVTGGEAAGGTSTPNDEYFLQNGPLDNGLQHRSFCGVW